MSDMERKIGKMLLVLVVVMSFVFYRYGTFAPDKKVRGERIGSKLTYAESEIKSHLRYPSSYDRLSSDVKRNSKGDITSITIEYTAKNGFGGTNRETQTISF